MEQVKVITKFTNLERVDYRKGATLLVNKPLEWTSFDVVGKLRNLIRKRYKISKIKVGHAGTLDPLATGLLIVCTGKHTKTINSLQGLNKSYRAEVKLGVVTNTFDKESEEMNPQDTSHLTDQQVIDVVQSFKGESEQIPPMFSAIKKNGTPLYKLAREGMVVQREPRKINIEEIDIIKYQNPIIELQTTVSKGTYIRTLANDIGAKLGVGGYLYSLVRTSVGEFSVDDALDMDVLMESLKYVD